VCGGDNGDGQSRGRSSFGYIHGRALTDDEVIWLHSEPFAFLQPIKRRVYRGPLVLDTREWAGSYPPARGPYSPSIMYEAPR
jgi:hypothetical protein